MFSFLHLIFLVFATVAVCSAVAVVTVRNPVHSVLSLVVTFFAMAGTWMILHAEFLSIILVLVYVGAVMTLFLFVVMMLNINVEARQGGYVRYWPFGLILIVLMSGIAVSVFGAPYFGITQMPMPAEKPADYSNIQHLGMVLYTDFAYPFEIAGVLLLAAIIAAITLTHRGPVRRRVQNTSAQIKMRPEDSVRIIKMASEPRPGGSA